MPFSQNYRSQRLHGQPVLVHSILVVSVVSPNPTQIIFTFLEFFVSIRGNIPQHFAHVRLFFRKVTRSLIGMQEKLEFTKDLFQLFCISRPPTVRDIAQRGRRPFGKMVVTGDAEFGRKDGMNRSNEVFNGAEHLHMGW